MSDQKTNSLLPTGAGIATYLISALVVLLAVNATRIWAHLSDGIAVDPVDLGTNVNIYWQKIDYLRHSAALGTISVMLFWGMIGSLVYASIWLLQTTFLKLQQDEDEVANQKEASRRSRIIQSTVAHYLLFGALTVIIAAYVFFFLGVILPSTRLLFFSAVTSSFAFQNVLSLLGTIVAMSVALYLLVVLLTLYARFWRVYLKPVL